VVTNLPFLRALVRTRAMNESAFDTEWIERAFLPEFSALASAPAPDLVLAAAAIAEATVGGRSPKSAMGGGGAASAGVDAFGAAGPWRHPGLGS